MNMLLLLLVFFALIWSYLVFKLFSIESTLDNLKKDVITIKDNLTIILPKNTRKKFERKKID